MKLKKKLLSLISTRTTLITFLTWAALTACSAAPVDMAKRTEEPKNLRWWHDAKFGMFIHFGLYSVHGGVWNGKPVDGFAEWVQANADIPAKDYAPLLSQFNPTNLNADAVVRAAKQAGMKYLVITTKHHDGFCLWPTKQQSDWNVAATPFKRDIIAELAAACKKHGIRFGTYYSITDWHHPTQFIQRDANGRASSDNYFQTRMHEGHKAEYVAYMKAQIAELVKNYDTDILWFDADWVGWWTLDDGKDLYNYIRALKPSIIINNRVAKRYEFKLDFGTPENETPGGALDHSWEACWTMNDSWGFKVHDHSWKSAPELIRKLVDITSKGGNLLLNVGPTGDGVIPPPSSERLREMGAWLKVNGEAIYGTQPVKPYRLGNVVFTRKRDGTVYAIALAAKDGDAMPRRVRVPAEFVAGKKSVKLLGSKGARLKVEPAADGTAEIIVPDDVAASPVGAWAFKLPVVAKVN